MFLVYCLHRAVSWYCRPAPKVTWTRLDDSLPNGKYEVEEDGTELVLIYVTDDEEGIYQCSASNTAGTANGQIKLDVQCELIQSVHYSGA